MAKQSYKTLQAQLDAVLTEMQSDDIDVERALELYADGQKILAELEAYLKTAENKVQKIKADWTTPAAS
ncbi:MAG: Exodeoxyribonuclease small subunit [Patescibacteria group bacterium]|nr:Exodeoxyribonuclease small subunit [Patescibacteria group bacterium]